MIHKGNPHDSVPDLLRYLARWGDAAGLYIADAPAQKRAARDGLVYVTDADNWRDRRVRLTDKGREAAKCPTP